MSIENTISVKILPGRNILLLLLCIAFSFARAQTPQQTNIWYFGNLAGLDFNSGSPVPLTNGILSTFEGTASIADRVTGQLLFYTDGDTIYDSTHNMMVNGAGLFGHNSSTQSGVIVPDPGNLNQYYVFTVGAQAGFVGAYSGVAYSIVDMTLNGGLGAVTTKNVQLVDPATEKISAVRHCNGRDVWIVTHEWNSDAFYTYLLTSSGVQAPVISNTGIIHQNIGSVNNSETIGYMKVAPDQQHIGLCTFHPMNVIQLFDFDNVLGTVANPITINMPVIGNYGGPYGCSFSPDGSKFYAAYHNFAGTPNYVFQYDMNAGSPAAIVASQTVVASTSAVSYGALQLASDGKMYMATFSNNSIGGSFGSPTIDRFTNPNALGLASGYVANAVFLGGGLSVWGLPDYIESFFSPPVATNFNDTTICTGASVTFNPVYGLVMDSITWNFDDIPSGALNYSNLPSPTHTFNAAGLYEVNLIVHYNCHHDTVTRKVTVNDLGIFLGNDTALCIGSALTLDPNYPGATYLWSNGTTMQTINVTSPGGTFWLQVTDGLCVAKDTINVTFNPPPQVNLGNDTTICTGQSLILDAGNAGAAFLWSNGATTQTISPLISGSYWVNADLTGCIDRDTIVVTVNQPPLLSLGNDTVLCNGQSLQLNASAAGYTNSWSNGTTNNSISVTTTGTFWVQLSNGACLVTDTINVQFNPPPVVNLGTDTIICSGQNLVLDAGNAGAAFLWNNGATTQTISPLTSGNYWVIADLSGCTDRDTILVTVSQPPQVFIGNDTILCNGQSLQLTAGAAGYTNLWSTGNTTSSISVSASGTYWVELNDGTCKITDTINVQFNPPPVVTLGNDTTICNGATVTLDAENAGAAYNWSNGATTQTIVVSVAATYVVTVNLSGCMDKDTFQLFVNQPPLLFLGNDTVLCNGNTLQLSASASGYNVLWSTGSTSGSINVTVAGTYAVELSDGICNVTDTINVNFDFPPVFNLGPDTTLCSGQILLLDAGIPAAAYLWNNGATNQQLSVSVSGNYFVEVTKGACSASDSILVDFIPLLPVQLGKDTALCEGQVLTIDAGLPGYTYLWSTGETSQSIVVSTDGNYVIEVFDGLCKSYDSIAVSFIAYPVVALGNDTSFCSNTPVPLDAGNTGATYLWSTGETTQVIVPALADDYWVIAAYGNCKATDTVNITVFPAPVVAMGEDSSLCSGDIVNVDAGNPGALYLWNDGSTSQVKIISATGTYIVTVTNSNDCISGDTIVFGTTGCQFYIFVPNSFSPNEDGRNDFFHPYPYNILSLEMTIYNRYGQKIFDTSVIEPGWDGTYKNTDCPEDVYVVLISYTGQDEKGNITEKRKKGIVSLIR